MNSGSCTTEGSQMKALLALLEVPGRLSHLCDVAQSLTEKVDQINTVVAQLARGNSSFGLPDEQEFFTPAEVAKLLGKRPYTVRQWCNTGRVNAQKRLCGRGKLSEWKISRAEIVRIKSDGLLPWMPERNRMKSKS
jgi:hypothetical protein